MTPSGQRQPAAAGSERTRGRGAEGAPEWRQLRQVRGGEDLLDQRLEVVEGERVVARVEGGLVELVGEALTQGEPGLPAVLLPGFGVGAEVLVVVATLEVLMGSDHVVQLLA